MTVRSLTSTKTVLAINLLASPGILHRKDVPLHWFEGKKYIYVSSISYYTK